MNIYGHGKFYWTSGVMAQEFQPPAGVNELLNLVLGAETESQNSQNRKVGRDLQDYGVQPSPTPQLNHGTRYDIQSFLKHIRGW